MSRRKQLNPNKVKLGDNGSEEQGDLGQPSCAKLTTLADGSGDQEEEDVEAEPKTHVENGAESETEVIPAGKGTEAILPNKPESDDLSSVKSMMSTVMSVGNFSGEAADPPNDKSPSKSSTRIGKIKQEAKDEKSLFICPLCEKNCGTQHQLTMHIRQHNTDSGGTTHSCSICGKSLSSASSLDRHMLVHSGERPYKCTICYQAFTTNGNMHRHMKIHEKEPTSSMGSSPPSPTKRRRLSVKRKLSQEEGETKEEELLSKKVTREIPSDEEEEKKIDEVLHCPICYKTFICKYGLETHMETHPDSSLRCNLCCICFKTHRGLLRHNTIIHKQLPTDVSGKPFIQNNPTIPVGFHDLGFIDFSCRKFPLISQVWSEMNLRRCTSRFHRFVCEMCNKAFPMLSALNLHLESHRGHLEGSQPNPEPQQPPDMDLKQKAFMASLGLQYAEEAKAVKQVDYTEFDVHNIWLDTSTWNLPQEANCATVKDQPPLDLASLGASLSSLSPIRDKVKILSLQPFQKGFIIQPDSSIVVKPISSESAIEFADIQQILKMASSAPSQISLPPLSKAPSIPTQSIYRQMPPLKPKPLVAPCTVVVTSTPSLLMSAQQASPGCVSPSLPPLQLVKSAAEPSASPQDLKLKPVNGSKQFVQPKTEPLSPIEMKTQLEQDSIIEALMPMEVNGAIKQEVLEGDLKDLMARTSGKKVPALKKVLYPCRFCNQVFAFSGVLKAHIRSHLGISPYQCNICTYIAADKAALIRHLRTHSGERPFICKICHYPFTVKANCERHLRKKHLKMTRKDIEKNIEYAESHTAELVDSFCSPDTVCKYCGEDLKYYRALRHHLRTHSSCQKKPFECRECSMGFSTKNNCIRHILKQHTHVEEKEVEKHILLVDCLVGENGEVSPTLSDESVSADGSPVPYKEPQNGFLHGPVPQSSLKMEPMGIFSMDLDEPLDFSQKNKSVSLHPYKPESHLLRKLTPPIAQFDSTLEPIDLSVPKNPPKDKANLGKENKDESQLAVNGGSFSCQQCPSTFQVKTNLDKHVSTKHSPQLQSFIPAVNPAGFSAVVASTSLLRPLRPKPPPLLLPKPAAAKELPPLASIAQIISSVSSAPALLTREIKDGTEATRPPTDKPEDLKTAPAAKTAPQREAGNATGTLGPPQRAAEKASMSAGGPVKRKVRRRGIKYRRIRPSLGSSIDPESSGEFASVEKMLAAAHTNKFTPFLQSTSIKEEPNKEEKASEMKEKRDLKILKGKKNSYSNSVQKITCPYCPRLFPWASSLQRHMLTHTGQKPYPCPKCDAYFSTKSNCERHLLRKHGVANRSLRRNGLIARSKATAAKPLESTGNHSESEAAGPATAPSATPTCPSPSATERPHADGAAGPGEPKAELLEECAGGGRRKDRKLEEEAEEDAQSNKSLDLNFASKLIDFKLGGQTPSGGDAGVQQEGRNTCTVCGKTFKYAATLARHRKAHACEHRRDGKGGRRGPRSVASREAVAAPEAAGSHEQAVECPEGSKVKGEAPLGDGLQPSRTDKAAESISKAGSSQESEHSAGEVPTEQHDLKKAVGNSSTKADKRKKICIVCNKRFWSLQDLTRHMRSHTGERPYKCLTCERTFTLKHSLVRHQRIHQKGVKVTKRHHRGENDDDLSKGDDDSESCDQQSDNESETVTSVSNDSPPPLSLAGSPLTATASQSPNQTGGKSVDPDSNLHLPAAVNGVRQGTFLLQGNDQASLKSSEKVLADSAGPSDIIQNLLAIRSGSPMNHVLSSVESAPRLLGVE
ncbi:ras-responsive element-binding protein 1 isoform X3 [Scyliorhinus canicula]|uniref:ras-responsive element-binding protein 1 isoform X3 n=1 Tax=Scyliorhinus canicula TaxID=7830 RepID=UPI0018F3FDE7|nr:ras-responsive element-binding protein 1 isoform X3 [Scyliorhinus canicula]